MGKYRILCIDDDPDVLEIVATTLSMKHEVATADNGVEAVAMLDAVDADFVICDVRMPKIDGFQTVEAIRHHPDYANVPVFFLTAEHDREMAKKGFASGANLYLTKPFDPMRLLKNVDHFLEVNGAKPRPKRYPVNEIRNHLKSERTASETSQASGGMTNLPPRVIVLCNDAIQLDLVSATLKTDYECLGCIDPIRALHQILRYEPDVLIINPDIPTLSGWGLVQLLRETPQLAGVPIILTMNPTKPIDERLIARITNQPPIPINAPPARFLSAVERIVRTAEFRVRVKQASLETLMKEEEVRRNYFENNRVREEKRQDILKTQYTEIQGFIDRHFT
jgi:DNA-binding response OmpR family regulator